MNCVCLYAQEEHLILHLHKPKTDKKVQWQEGTVDNEFMGKKTSKCELSKLEKGDYNIYHIRAICIFHLSSSKYRLLYLQ